MTDKYILGASKRKYCRHHTIKYTARPSTLFAGIVHTFIIQSDMTQTFHTILPEVGCYAVLACQGNRQASFIRFKVS